MLGGKLNTLLAVVEQQNFTKAAKALALTQPAVSHQINTLEDELGVKLFYRTSKRVRLTQAGHLFSQYAREILSLSRMSKARLKEGQDSSVLRFGIGCRSFLELRLLGPVLGQLREEFPQLMPVLRLVPFDSLENLLEDGDVQVMFTFQETAPKRAVYRELSRRAVVCVCGKDHPLAACGPLDIQPLREGERFAAYPPHSAPPSLLAVQGQIITGRSTDQICFCEGLETLYTLVEAGFAFAVIADLPQVAMPGIRAIPVQEFPALSYGVSYQAGEMGPVLRRFLARMEEFFQAGDRRV